MRRLTIVAAALVFLPVSVQAAEPTVPAGTAAPLAVIDEAKISYKRGLNIQLPQFDMKINLKNQLSYAYNDYEDDSEEDASKFDVKKMRLQFSGNALDKAFTYKVENDFVAGRNADDRKGSALKDGWIQWNADPMASLRAGQFKVPFSRQEVASDFALSFPTRSAASDYFAPKRNVGAMLLGPLVDNLNYSLGIFNGQSDKEGENFSGVDPDVMGVAAVNASTDSYGSREEEGDYPFTEKFAATGGLSAMYGSAKRGDIEFDKADLNADTGLRFRGFSVQTEAYLSNRQPDEGDSATDWGFYFQTGWFFVPQVWEVEARYSYIGYGEGMGQDLDKTSEYSFEVSRFINGHDLKVVAAANWLNDEPIQGDGTTDFRVELMLNAVF